MMNVIVGLIFIEMSYKSVNIDIDGTYVWETTDYSTKHIFNILCPMLWYKSEISSVNKDILAVEKNSKQ